MAEFEREMIDRFDMEDKERRQLSGEPPHGRDWPYLTMQEIAAGWGLPRANIENIFTRTPEVRDILSGGMVTYGRGGSKCPARRISVGAFQRVRAHLNEQLAGKRTFRDLDQGMFARDSGPPAVAVARCVSIDGVAIPGQQGPARPRATPDEARNGTRSNCSDRTAAPRARQR
jgi:hypothetical protein